MIDERLKLEQVVRRIAEYIGEAAQAAALQIGLEERVGYALILFDFGEEGNLAYASNADRSDMIKTLKEMIKKLEHV